MSAYDERPTLAQLEAEEHPPLRECPWCSYRAMDGADCRRCGAHDDQAVECGGCGEWLDSETDFTARVGYGDTGVICEACWLAAEAERSAA